MTTPLAHRSYLATFRRNAMTLTGYLCLASVLAGSLGCGRSEGDQSSTIVASQEDPEGEFEWAMKRLDRALRLFRPNTSDGLITTRSLEHELFPPTQEQPEYTARVTVVSETSFLHGKREVKRADSTKPESKQDVESLLNEEGSDFKKYEQLPGVGPQAPSAFTPNIETRSMGKKTVFDLIYRDGQWELTEQPELKYEKLWFEYAFQQN